MVTIICETCGGHGYDTDPARGVGGAACPACQGTGVQSADEIPRVHPEIERLARYLLDRWPHEPGGAGVSESAVDVAIRLLERYRTST